MPLSKRLTPGTLIYSILGDSSGPRKNGYKYIAMFINLKEPDDDILNVYVPNANGDPYTSWWAYDARFLDNDEKIYP